MGHAEHHQDGSVTAAHAAGHHGTREIPGDWFLDPADPAAAERFRTETEQTLEDQATAFLAAHTLAEELDEDTPVAISPLSLAAPPRSAPADNADKAVWIGLPGTVREFDDYSDLGWQADALCAQTDPEAFFPEKGGSTRDAKKVCGSCNVKAQCLEFALENDERFGIWGGLSERERRRLRKRTG